MLALSLLTGGRRSIGAMSGGRPRRLLLNGGLVVVLVAVGVGSYMLFAGGEGSQASGQAATATVTRGTVRSTVSASGTVVSPRTLALNFTTGGTVAQVSVEVGDHVTKGQVLAHVDASSYQAELQSAYASVGSSEAGLVSAQASVGSSEAGLVSAQANLVSAQASLADLKKGDPTDAQLAEAEAQVASARSQVAQAEASITSARAQIDQAEASITSARSQVAQVQETIDGTVLTAPMTGTLISVNEGVGDTVSSGGVSSVSTDSSTSGATSTSSSSSSGTSAFIEISDLDHLQVRAYFSETDAAKLKVGQTAIVTLNALPGKRASGKAVTIDPTSTTVNQVVDYGVTVKLLKQPKGIRVGQTAVVEVVTGRVTNVLSVPSAAIGTAGAQHTVIVLQNGRQVTRVVQVGLEGDQTTEIVSGLSEGDKVVISSATGSTGGFPTGGFPGLGGGLGG